VQNAETVVVLPTVVFMPFGKSEHEIGFSCLSAVPPIAGSGLATETGIEQENCCALPPAMNVPAVSVPVPLIVPDLNTAPEPLAVTEPIVVDQPSLGQGMLIERPFSEVLEQMTEIFMVLLVEVLMLDGKRTHESTLLFLAGSTSAVFLMGAVAEIAGL